MQKVTLIFFILALSITTVSAQVTAELLTKTGKAGGTVLIKGSGFGSDRDAVKVFFDGSPGKIISVRDESIAVQVPTDVPMESQVVVDVGGVRSEPMAFKCAPSVKLTTDKNPLPVGETTTGRFQVFHSERPVTINFVNESPEVVTFTGGDQQSGRTCGGPNNILEFQIVGKGGPRLYDVGYTYTFDVAETVEWKLPWGKADLTSK
jgi:IPT/TIG domain